MDVYYKVIANEEYHSMLLKKALQMVLDARAFESFPEFVVKKEKSNEQKDSD